MIYSRNVKVLNFVRICLLVSAKQLSLHHNNKAIEIMAKEIKLYVKAFQDDWRGVQWEEDRYIISENGINMYDQSFDLATAENVLRFGFSYLISTNSQTSTKII